MFDYPSALTLGKKEDKTNEEVKAETKASQEDPTMTKVVDRRWYERNKHIFPASMWETFDPNKARDPRQFADPD